MVTKKDIRRVVCGTCVVVAPPGEGSSAAAAPSEVTVNVRRRRGCCGWLARPWKELASFSFSDRARAPFFKNAFLDLERVIRYTRKADAGAAQVKICVKLRSGVTRVARVSLEDFMGQLLQSGSPECFVLYVHEGKVVLVQAKTPLPEVPTAWPFDGVASGTHRGQQGAKDHRSNEPKVTVPKKSQGKTEIIDQELENNASDVAENGKEAQEKTVEAITVSDEEKEPLSDKEESGRGDEDSNESDWESLEVTDEESDLDTDEGTDGEAECEDDDEDSEDSEREPDDDTGKPDVETEETESEADDEHSEEETEPDEDSDGSWGETSEDEAEEDTAGEGPGSEGGRVRLFLGWLGWTLRHHSRGLVVAAEVALITGTLKVWGPPAYMANWWWGGAGGEL